MKNLRLAILSFFIIIAQVTILKYAEIAGIVPNITAICVICFALIETNFTKATVYAFLCGLALDCISNTVFGLQALLCTFCGALCSYVSNRFFKGKYAVCLLFSFILSIVYETIYYLLAFATLYEISFVRDFVFTVLPTAIYNTVVAMPLLVIMRKICSEKEN